MKSKILNHLTQIELNHKVRVLYACESGSRAWGFESTDSDYDVRFIYAHKLEWYLSISDKCPPKCKHDSGQCRRDVIEYPGEVLDISGWDIRKALGLLRKGNPPLMEWLGSPIVYLENHATAFQLRKLQEKHFNPTASMYHYLHMARGNCRDYFTSDTVRLKKYFYVLRPLLAMRWIEQNRGIVPTRFDEMFTTIDFVIAGEIQRLVRLKKAGAELGRGSKISVLSRFIDDELKRHNDARFDKTDVPPVDEFNNVFRDAVKR